MTMLANAKKYDWTTWIMGLMRSVVSGGANSVISGLTTMGIDPDHFNFQTGLKHMMVLMVFQFVLGAVIHMLIFLQTHGSPDAAA